MKHAKLRHWKVLALLTLATLATPPLLLWTSTFAQAKKPITKDGLVEAIRLKGFTTKELVKQIETRGVSFEMTSEIEAEMRGAGAQPELIEAARANYRPASPFEQTPQLPKGTGALTINSTMAGCQVFLNGVSRGVTNTDGTLRLPLKAGRYKVVLKKENYEEQERSVIVASGAEAVESFSLTAIQGRLTVNTSIPGADVTLNGVEFPAGIRDLSIPAETYEVRVSKPGFRTFTKTITLNPRGSVTVDASLEPVPIEESLAQVASYLQAKRYPEAISSGREVLASHPNNSKANLLMGLAYYYSDQYSDGVEFLTKAITLGEQVVLPIKHHHAAFLSDDLCTGRITIGRGTIAFSSTDRGGHDFIVPANKIYGLKFEPDKAGRVHVRVGIQKGKGTKEDKKTYNFHVIHAYLIPANPNDPSSIKSVRCDNCGHEAQLVYQLLGQLKETPSKLSDSPN